MSLQHEGRVWFRGALRGEALTQVETICALGSKPGARLSLGDVDLTAVTALAATVLPGARPVRLIAFDKSAANNWTVAWHQDRVVAVRERCDAQGFSNWTNKAGVWHAEPPIEILQRMLFARIHVDPSDQDNGCLQLALGTHTRKIAAGEADAVAHAAQIETCVAARGDILFAAALTLHRSAPSRSDSPRRALRIDYCADDLPAPLEWAP